MTYSRQMKELAFIGAENRTAVGSLVDGIEHEVGSLFLSLFVCVCVCVCVN